MGGMLPKSDRCLGKDECKMTHDLSTYNNTLCTIQVPSLTFNFDYSRSKSTETPENKTTDKRLVVLLGEKQATNGHTSTYNHLLSD